MNFKNQAQLLEQFLEDEFRKNTPLVVLKDKSLIYKRMRVVSSKDGRWKLKFTSGDEVDAFYLKASAAIAAKYYDLGKFDQLGELKILDFQFWQASSDEHFFKYKIDSTKDTEKLDIFLARWDLSKTRSKIYRKKIISLFKLAFDK